ncbi:hypothetical protein [Flavobacterium sp. LM4]|uniref:hypothetical protein n=1 Tax=Flavobacterium sp. LM4 TaxID=1938609 RepID=UPI000992F9F5|nr:hypothetical protein [Flavobacterium sp. LM4]OOV19827.1 hypothetical protein BXU10_09395 [Flavobacterium sp. LM4]
MKKTALIIFVLQLITTSIAFSQESKDITEITLMKSTNKTIGLALGESTEKAIQIFGEPNSISDFYSETTDETLKTYNYGKNKLYFSNGRLQSFEIRESANILVGKINGDSFKIGDKIKTVTKQIPLGPPSDKRWTTEKTYSFYNYPLSSNPTGKFNNMNYKTISNNYLKKENKGIDMYIQLLFDINNALIAIDIIEI